MIPSHKSIERNELADNITKNATTNKRSPMARCSSLTHVNRVINKAKESEIHFWHQTRIKKREKRSQKYYTLCLKPRIYPVLEQLAKKYAVYFILLKVGYGVVEVFLERIKAVKTVFCWWCGQVKQSMVHLFGKCRK